MPAKPLPTKELTCSSCGNSFTSTQSSNWCKSCGKQVFYDPKDARRSRWTQFYVNALIVIIIGLAAYFFIEFILTPMLQLQQGG